MSPNNAFRLSICSVIVLSLISISTFSDGNTAVNVNKAEVPDCNPSAPIPANLNGTSGTLKVQTGALEKNSVCEWIIRVNTSTIKSETSLVFIVKNFKLDEKDNLTVSYGAKNTVENYTTTFKPNSLLITGIKKEETVTIKLEIGTAKSSRLFKVEYNFDGNIENIISESDEQNSLTVVHTKADFTVSNLSFAFQLAPAIKDIYQLVISVYESTLNVSAKSFQFSGTLNPVGDFSQQIGDLFAQDNEVKISINGLQLSSPIDQHLILHYTLYDKGCSHYYKDPKDNKIIVYPTSDKFESINCLTLIERPKEGYSELDYSGFSFINNLDTLIIRSGNRLTSPISSIVNRESLSAMQNNYLNILQGPTVHITYQCLSTKSDAVNPKGASLTIKPHTGIGGVFNSPVAVKVAALTNNTYILVGNGKNGNMKAFINTISGSQILDEGTVKIFDSLHVDDSKPLIQISKGELLPENIWSKNNVLRLHLFNVSKLDFSLNFTESNLNSIANYESDVKVISGKQLLCDHSATWLIPSLEKVSSLSINQSFYLLSIPYIVLNSSDDCVEIKALNKTKISLTKICGDNLNPVIDQSLPAIMMNSTVMHEVTYKRGNVNCNLNDTSIIFQSSLLSNSIQNIQHRYSLQMNKPLTITEDTYPNSYILRGKTSIELCRVQNTGCGHLIVANADSRNKTKLVGLVKFEDLDLAENHEVLLKFNSVEDPKTLTSKSPLPDDFLIENVELVQLLSPYKDKYSISEKVSGRGFKLSVYTHDCGTTVRTNQSRGHLITEDIIKGEHCVFIIDGQENGLIDKILNFTINYANVTNGAKKGRLTIYDSPTLRDETKLIINESRTYNPASVNRTIIVYEKVDSKAPLLGLSITFKLDDCYYYCDNDTRCILAEWRCDNRSHCKDGQDQAYCNSTCPNPKPQPTPSQPTNKGGVSGYVISFVIIPLSMIVGALVARFGPIIIRRFRGGNYQEFSSLSDVN